MGKKTSKKVASKTKKSPKSKKRELPPLLEPLKQSHAIKSISDKIDLLVRSRVRSDYLRNLF